MKQYLLLVLAGSWPAVLHAQRPPSAPGTTAESPAAKATVRVGVKAGFNYSNTNFNQGYPTPVVPIETRWRPGFLVGAVVSVALPHRFAVQQEYLFSQVGGEIAGGARYTMRYLSLPLLLSYQVLPRVALQLGPQADLLIQAQAETSGQTTDITHDTEERNIGAVGGVAVQLGAGLGLSARYVQGLNHVGIGQRSAVQEFKYQVVQVAASYTF